MTSNPDPNRIIRILVTEAVVIFGGWLLFDDVRQAIGLFVVIYGSMFLWDRLSQ